MEIEENFFSPLIRSTTVAANYRIRKIQNYYTCKRFASKTKFGMHKIQMCVRPIQTYSNISIKY